jgi:hypothetical protein
MAIPDNTFTTYEAIGQREDLIDVITNISPMDTWFTSNSGTVRATGRFHEWQTDALAAAAANAVIEGDDATATAITPTVRLGNYTQILRKTFQITDTEDMVDKAGRDSELSYQTQKNLKELARDIEYALIINSASASGASGTARQTKGVLGYIATNVTTGSGTGTQVLTESMLNDNLAAIWAQGGMPANVLCGAFQKRKISNFTTNTRNITASEEKLVRSVDVYQSDFGILAIRLHHQLNTTTPGTVIILGDMGLWKKAWLRPVKQQELARTGASTKMMIEAELALESRQEKGSGKITELTVA